MRISPRLAGSLALGVTWAAAAVAAAAVAAPTSPASEPGVWQKHDYSFAFMGFTSTYSCDGLADKLKLLLLTAGARPDVKVRPGACASGFGRPDKFARSELSFYTLIPATGGTAAPDAADKPADGVWKSVALSRHRPRELTTGDCELVEQFRSNVLPMFTTRNVDNHTTCIPHQESGSVVDLKFDAFAAVAKPKTAP